jgi:hypothetical protein
MRFNSPSVYIEEPAMSLGESMDAIRSWLDHNKIQPIELNTTTRQAYRPLALPHRHRSAQPLHARKPVAASGVAAKGENGATGGRRARVPYREHVERQMGGWAGVERDYEGG